MQGEDAGVPAGYKRGSSGCERGGLGVRDGELGVEAGERRCPARPGPARRMSGLRWPGPEGRGDARGGVWGGRCVRSDSEGTRAGPWEGTRGGTAGLESSEGGHAAYLGGTLGGLEGTGVGAHGAGEARGAQVRPPEPPPLPPDPAGQGGGGTGQIRTRFHLKVPSGCATPGAPRGSRPPPVSFSFLELFWAPPG